LASCTLTLPDWTVSAENRRVRRSISPKRTGVHSHASDDASQSEVSFRISEDECRRVEKTACARALAWKLSGTSSSSNRSASRRAWRGHRAYAA
jgi:hypothetical protein